MKSVQEAPNIDEESLIQQLEEIALVEAIRDTFLPGLSVSDAVMFATLIVDVFQTADATTIFLNRIQEVSSSVPYDNSSNFTAEVSNKLSELPIPSHDAEGKAYFVRSVYFYSI